MPDESCCSWFEDPLENAHYLEGFAHFNAGRYWEAHESWEEVWLPRDGEAALFLQALIQLAAGFHHVTHTGRYHGAVASWTEARRKLGSLEGSWYGVDVEALSQRLDELIDRAASVVGEALDPATAFPASVFFRLEPGASS